MTKLEMLSGMGLKPNWTTVFVGWQPLHAGLPSLLTNSDVVEYATEQLRGDESEGDPVLSLACAQKDETESISNYLRVLSQTSHEVLAMEERKWRLFLLNERLANLPADPVDGLMDLTSFWAQFDFPEDGPHIVQGRDNQIDPAHYYTEQNLCRLLEFHRQWVQDETRKLRSVC